MSVLVHQNIASAENRLIDIVLWIYFIDLLDILYFRY
jgi:hypothetical protein